MPFIFVDYDQGAGGEFFCHGISSEQGCIPLRTESTERGRYKVFDLFNQEFLKKYPQVSYKPAHDTLYEVVPSHRNTYIAKDIGLDFKSIRIKFPTTKRCIDFVLHQKVNKVLLAPLPSVQQFFGELETLSRESKNKNWIKQTSKDMDNLTLHLLANDIDPTPENKQVYLEKMLQDIRLEPEFNYDLAIEYESLIYDTNLIKQQIESKFDIQIKGAWLEKYKKNYDAYYTKT